MPKPEIWQFIPEMSKALKKQLLDDQRRWGDVWLKRTRLGQEERIEKTIQGYFDDYHNSGVPIPWLKIIGNAMIAWLRDNHPEIWPE